MLQDKNFAIYNESYVHLNGTIRSGCLEITSEIDGDDDMYWDEEKHYVFSESQTEKLFSIISLEKLIASCRKGRLIWLEDFLREHKIDHDEWCF